MYRNPSSTLIYVFQVQKLLSWYIRTKAYCLRKFCIITIATTVHVKIEQLQCMNRKLQSMETVCIKYAASADGLWILVYSVRTNEYIIQYSYAHR